MRSCRYELRRSGPPACGGVPQGDAHTRGHTRARATSRAHARTQTHAITGRSSTARAPRMLHASSASPARRAGSRVPLGLAAAGARRAAALELVLLEGHVGEGELLVVGGARGARRGEGRAFREEDALPAYWKDRRLGDFGGASRPHHRSLPLRGPERLSCDSCSPRVRAAAKSMGSQPGRRAVALST